MKNKLNPLFLFATVILVSTVILPGCTKDKIITPNSEASLFATDQGSYFITSDPNTVFKIPVGITRVPDKSRTIEFTVSSPSGAVEGQQYMLSGNTITIPAGQTVDSITLNGVFSAYPAGRRDTLIFTITGGDIPSLVGSDVYTLILQKYCVVDLNALLGDYDNSNDNQDPDVYGPYSAKIVSATSTGSTSAQLVIKYFSDAALGPFGAGDPSYDTGITVNIDWSDPANFFTTLPTQPVGYYPPYGLITLTGVGNGYFSSCDNIITISYKATVSAGSFGNFVTVLSR